MNATDTELQVARRLNAALEAARPWTGQELPPAIAEELARAMLAAPAGYWQQMPEDMAQEWRQWALAIIEPIDYAPFFELLHRMKDMPRGEIPDEDFKRLVELAPPRFLREASAAVPDLVPTPTHCDEQGNPVFSAQEIAEHLGTTPEEVERDIERMGLGDRLYTGPVHAIQ